MQGDRIAWELGRKKTPINRKCSRNLGFPGGSDGEESAYNAGDLGSIFEMKISSAISINKKCHGHQQFLASKCEWELTKLRSRWCCHAPCWLLRSWGNARSKVRKETGLAQTPEVHMKRMNSMSPEAYILPSCSVQFRCSVAYNSFWPHGLQHHRPPCPSPTPRAYSNSRPCHQWCHPNISSSVVPCSSRLQSFPASGSLPISQFFYQVAKVLEFQLQHQCSQWILRTDFLLIPDWIIPDWMVESPCNPKDSQEFSPHHSSKASILWCSAFFLVQLSHPYMTTGKIIALTRQTFVGKVMSLLFNMLSRLFIAFLPRRKRLLISWLQSLSVMMLELEKLSLSLFPLFPHLFAMKWWDQMPRS